MDIPNSDIDDSRLISAANRDRLEAFRGADHRESHASPAPPDEDGNHNFDGPPPPSSWFPLSTIVKTLGIAVLLVALFVVAGLPLWNYLNSYESTDDAEIDGHIAPISSRIDGTIGQVYVEETQTVKAGQLLAAIDPRDQEVAVETARANLSLAQAQVGSARADYQAALGKLRESEANAVKAEHDVDRYTTLLGQEIVARADYDEKIRVTQVAVATVEAGRAAANSTGKVIAARQASVQAAQAALDQALLNLSYTKIVAPSGGVIGKKTVEVGQRVQPGEQLMAIVGLDDIWVTADFKETQIRRMHAGERATVHVDELGHDYQAYVQGLAGASGEIYSLLPPENATGNYVKVVQRVPIRLRFKPGQDFEHKLRPGLSVEPKVWLR
jgi:membrane fusion protein, multidrug efflux system